MRFPSTRRFSRRAMALVWALIAFVIVWGDGVPVLDLILLGLGSDGHCGSIFPGKPAFAERRRAVVGVPDPVLGFAIKAVVALDSGVALTAADVIRHCARNLEDFMVPKIVEFRDRLPKSENGKIARRQVEAESLEAVQ